MRATVVQPGLPGATNRLPVKGDLTHARANACSRAPEPRISKFVLPSRIPFIRPSTRHDVINADRAEVLISALDATRQRELTSVMFSLAPEPSNRKWIALASHRAWLLRQAEASIFVFRAENYQSAWRLLRSR